MFGLLERSWEVVGLGSEGIEVASRSASLRYGNTVRNRGVSGASHSPDFELEE